MTKQESTPEYVTREILKEEISASEKRLTATLDSKIENSSQSLKDYTDSRIAPVMNGIHRLEETVKQRGAKMDRYYEGIVKMIEGVTGKVAIADDRLKDHEVRITALEGRGPQSGRI